MSKLELKDTETYYHDLWTGIEGEEQGGERSEPEEQQTEIGREELEQALKKTKNAKAPEEDGLSAELYKYAITNLKKRLLKFFNSMLWKEETT